MIALVALIIILLEFTSALRYNIFAKLKDKNERRMLPEVRAALDDFSCCQALQNIRKT
jgi:hypothetical protein